VSAKTTREATPECWQKRGTVATLQKQLAPLARAHKVGEEGDVDARFHTWNEALLAKLCSTHTHTVFGAYKERLQNKLNKAHGCMKGVAEGGL